MAAFKNGDIVWHSILETRKVIVGSGKDRYLCVHPEEIGPDGKIRPNARVAMHRADNLEKVGFQEGVVEVDLEGLYKKESFARHKVKRFIKDEIVTNALFVLAAVLIVLALLSLIDRVRLTLDQKANEQLDRMEAEYRQRIKRELQGR